MQVKSDVKAGGMSMQHNEAQVRPAGLKVQTGVKAGKVVVQDLHFMKGADKPSAALFHS